MLTLDADLHNTTCPRSGGRRQSIIRFFSWFITMVQQQQQQHYTQPTFRPDTAPCWAERWGGGGVTLSRISDIGIFYHIRWVHAVCRDSYVAYFIGTPRA